MSAGQITETTARGGIFKFRVRNATTSVAILGFDWSVEKEANTSPKTLFKWERFGVLHCTRLSRVSHLIQITVYLVSALLVSVMWWAPIHCTPPTTRIVLVLFSKGRNLKDNFSGHHVISHHVIQSQDSTPQYSSSGHPFATQAQSTELLINLVTPKK